MTIIAKHKDTGKIINKGDLILDFRGDIHEFVGCNQQGRNRVYTKRDATEHEYFPSVFDLVLETVE